MKRNKFLNYIAFGISAIFSPYISAAIFIIAIIYNYAHSLDQFLPWMLTFFCFAILVPGFYILWLLEANRISDVHMSNPEERKIPLLVAAISSLVAAVILYFLDAARPVFLISVIYAINSLAIAAITQWWKISVHTGMFASIVTIIVVIFGLPYLWLYALLIPLAWSRIYRKKHTIWQTMAGAVITSALTLLIFIIFGYIS